jgi:pseudaminic acid synthase
MSMLLPNFYSELFALLYFLALVYISAMGSRILAELTQSGTLVVAEVSGNHSGNLELCKRLVLEAKLCGANAVKFQTYTPDTLTLDSDEEDFRIPSNSPWAHFGNQYSLYNEAHTPWDWHQELFDYARSLDILAFSSPFDETAVDFLEDLNCPIYKLASPEINHLPLIIKIAKTGKPIIMSLGVATEEELVQAIETFQSYSSAEIGILQCDTNYPAPLVNANLIQIKYLSEKFPHIIGYSDHTLGSTAAAVAVALGAKIIEKHIRVDDFPIESPDHFFSTSGDDFKLMTEIIRDVEISIGKTSFRQQHGSEDFSIRRSIYPACDIELGQTLSGEVLKIVRPGYGPAPSQFQDLVGRVARRNIKRGTRISEKDFHE